MITRAPADYILMGCLIFALCLGIVAGGWFMWEFRPMSAYFVATPIVFVGTLYAVGWVIFRFGDWYKRRFLP